MAAGLNKPAMALAIWLVLLVVPTTSGQPASGLARSGGPIDHGNVDVTVSPAEIDEIDRMGNQRSPAPILGDPDWPDRPVGGDVTDLLGNAVDVLPDLAPDTEPVSMRPVPLAAPEPSSLLLLGLGGSLLLRRRG